MRVDFDLEMSVQENADYYYSLSKRAKRKLDGLEKGVEEVKKKISEQESKAPEKQSIKVKRKREWYEKFHWFFTSDNFLVVAGKDAKTNEIVVKKLMKSNDLYFHADIHGAPHTVILSEGKEIPANSKFEAAVFAAVFSKAWREKIPAVDVYSASPEQVSKSAPSGESLGTGAFMVYGKREWFKKTPLNFAVGFEGENLFSGPVESVKAKTNDFALIKFGADSKGNAAKKIRAKFSKKGFSFSLDDVVSLLPSGGISVE